MFEHKTSAAIGFTSLRNDAGEIAANQNLDSREWSQGTEGQLSIDVLETPEELCVVAPMAGTRPEDVEIHLHDDVLTIRGIRQEPLQQMRAAHSYQECYWGPFSRTIVLPVDIRSDIAQSEYRNGVLIIRLPKAKVSSSIPILVVEE